MVSENTDTPTMKGITNSERVALGVGSKTQDILWGREDLDRQLSFQ